jgi:hypothetical protein
MNADAFVIVLESAGEAGTRLHRDAHLPGDDRDSVATRWDRRHS